MVLLLLLIAILAVATLAMRQAPLWQWGLAALAIGLLSRIGFDGGPSFATDTLGLVLVVLPGVVLLLLSVDFIRRPVLTGPAYGFVKSILPRVSRTEQEALDAGTIGWDAELFSGRPKWERLLNIRKLTLSPEEQAFIDGPANRVCAMIDDWDTRNTRADLAPEVWQYLKDNGFFGMLIAKEYGGLGFSAQAQSMIVSKIASRSVAAGITVMVPNSLGPGELLEKYGTTEQKDKYLARLAKGLEVPCFALTGPHAGSDAAGMRDVGVVTYGTYEGKKTLGVKLSWDKRYITLAPVATLLGLAFHLHDPDDLLGKGENVGITLALVPADYPGVEIGRRHFPARSAFMNGPTRGKNVFIPMEFLIGGTDYAGQGWRMLMECLSTGRAISLPAIGSMSLKQSLRVTSAYARIRRQFGIAIGMMEGVAEPMGRLVKSAYLYEAGRRVTASMVDEGQKPSVLSAILKYRTTEAMRVGINDAMDIHGGRAIQDGPSNYLFSGYMNTPVAITVEGANILTRTLITFAQGALRAHPFLYAEIEAVQNPNKRAGLVAFDRAFSGHIGFMLRNIVGSFLHGISAGRFASTPFDHEMGPWYQQLARYSQSFALVGDWTVAFLGGDLKRKQRLSGRLADILSELYLLSATLKRFEDEGRLKEDAPVVDAIARDAIFAIEQDFAAVFANFPNPVLANLMRVLVFPLGRHARPASDRANYRLARAVLAPSEFRDRLTMGSYVSSDPKDVTGMLEDTLKKVVKAEEIETKFVRAIKKGVIERRLDRDAISDAVAAGVLTNDEASVLRAADEATDRVIKVDDFDPDELGSRQVPRTPRIETAAE
ncbi:MAG TPA: acyl-CoA dehydrogenase [Arsenicitalea sp.]|nr:acyl-CoA dehydrogenase [Arsenicitalea sp.]